MTDTADLLAACRAGDPRAAETLVRAHHHDVFRLALSILDDAAEADDAAQEVLVAALRALGDYRGDATLKTWLYAATVNHCRSRLRKRRVRERLVQALQRVLHAQRAAGAAEDAAIRHEAHAAVWRAVDALDERHRLPVILYYYHELPVSEIAAVLDIPAATVYSRLHHARERLRTALGDGSL